VRWHHGDRQVVTDCFIFGLWNAILARAELAELVIQKTEGLDGFLLMGLRFLIIRFAIPLVLLAYFSRRTFRKSAYTPRGSENLSAWTVPYPKAKIFPCQTKHARMFPKRHAFEYSYLQCGFPIIPAGVSANGSEVGSDNDAQLGCWWMRIHAGDYLTRENGYLGFYNKVKKYLQDQVGKLRIFCKKSFGLLTIVERGRCRLVICISRHGPTLLRLCFQSRLVLVHL
jgi:hypothetical protein